MDTSSLDLDQMVEMLNCRLTHQENEPVINTPEQQNNEYLQESLIESIQEKIPEIANEWNDGWRDELLKTCFNTTCWNDVVNRIFGSNTAEITKWVSPIISNRLYVKLSHELGDIFVADNNRGYDFYINLYESKLCVEDKLTLSEGTSWTGNGYGKTDIHLLRRMKLNDSGDIEGYFTAMIDLSKSVSQWTIPGKTSNFSTLALNKDDELLIRLIHGSIDKKTKYVQPILKIHNEN